MRWDKRNMKGWDMVLSECYPFIHHVVPYRYSLTLNSSPSWKGKPPSRTSSPQLPPRQELQTTAFSSPWALKRGLMWKVMSDSSGQILTAKLKKETRLITFLCGSLYLKWRRTKYWGNLCGCSFHHHIYIEY